MRLYYLRKPCRDLLIIEDRIHKRASITTCGIDRNLPTANNKSQANAVLKRFLRCTQKNIQWNCSVEQAEILLKKGEHRILAEH